MKKLMIVIILTMLAALTCASGARANDVDVYDVSLQNVKGTGTGTTVDIKFSVAQKNVFPEGLPDGNTAGGTNHGSYDRVWIFVKYFKTTWAADTAWKHATLVPGGSVGNYASYNGTSGGVGIVSGGKGAFVKALRDQTIRWNIGNANDEGVSVSTSSAYKVRVIAIEMVYVPTGPFWIGDNIGSTIDDRFIKSQLPNVDYGPKNIDSASVSPISYRTATGTGSWTIPASFPNGYNGFYIMKYELSQKEYCDFLNMLTRAQQLKRIDNGTDQGDFALYDNPVVASRNGIKLLDKPASGLLTFGCDLDDDGTAWEGNDGQWIACNRVVWQDKMAYADWACLRPMTEFEFEKACRGGSPTSNVVTKELAWGTSSIITATNVNNYQLDLSGTACEAILNSTYSSGGPVGNAMYTGEGYYIDGPVRCGIFAAGTPTYTDPDRAQSGASFYGVMELSGNVYEAVVKSALATFSGSHGDGSLNTNGYADDNSDWPGYVITDSAVTGFANTGFRGGNYNSTGVLCVVSNRDEMDNTDGTRATGTGGRFVRTE